MYKATGKIVKRKGSRGLRWSTVKNHPGLIMDQYGRTFQATKKMEFVGVGYATH